MCKVLTFTLNKKSYTLNTDSMQERVRILREIYHDTGESFGWMQEDTGNHHWVLFNVKMYSVKRDKYDKKYLNYRDTCGLTPTMPINATSYYRLFCKCDNLKELDLSHFCIDNIVNLNYIFYNCKNLKVLRLAGWTFNQVISMRGAFAMCKNLREISVTEIPVKLLDKEKKTLFKRCGTQCFLLEAQVK